MKNSMLIALSLACLAGAAFADDERPACPTGEADGWRWSYDEDHMWLTDQDAEVTWALANGKTATTTGVTLVWYYQPWSESKYVTYQQDGDYKLQNGIYLTPVARPNEFPPSFTQDPLDRKHDYYKALSINGSEVIAPDYDWESTWNPERSKSVYLGETEMPAAGQLNAAFETGNQSFSVTLWTKSLSASSYSKTDYGTGSFTTRPMGPLIDTLKPKMEAEAKRAKASGIYCVEADY